MKTTLFLFYLIIAFNYAFSQSTDNYYQISQEKNLKVTGLNGNIAFEGSIDKVKALPINENFVILVSNNDDQLRLLYFNEENFLVQDWKNQIYLPSDVYDLGSDIIRNAAVFDTNTLIDLSNDLIINTSKSYISQSDSWYLYAKKFGDNILVTYKQPNTYDYYLKSFNMNEDISSNEWNLLSDVFRDSVGNLVSIEKFSIYDDYGTEVISKIKIDQIGFTERHETIESPELIEQLSNYNESIKFEAFASIGFKNLQEISKLSEKNNDVIILNNKLEINFPSPSKKELKKYKNHIVYLTDSLILVNTEENALGVITPNQNLQLKSGQSTFSFKYSGDVDWKEHFEIENGNRYIQILTPVYAEDEDYPASYLTLVIDKSDSSFRYKSDQPWLSTLMDDMIIFNNGKEHMIVSKDKIIEVNRDDTPEEVIKRFDESYTPSPIFGKESFYRYNYLYLANKSENKSEYFIFSPYGNVFCAPNFTSSKPHTFYDEETIIELTNDGIHVVGTNYSYLGKNSISFDLKNNYGLFLHYPSYYTYEPVLKKELFTTNSPIKLNQAIQTCVLGAFPYENFTIVKSSKNHKTESIPMFDEGGYFLYDDMGNPVYLDTLIAGSSNSGVFNTQTNQWTLEPIYKQIWVVKNGFIGQFENIENHYPNGQDDYILYNWNGEEIKRFKNLKENLNDEVLTEFLPSSNYELIDHQVDIDKPLIIRDKTSNKYITAQIDYTNVFYYLENDFIDLSLNDYCKIKGDTLYFNDSVYNINDVKMLDNSNYYIREYFSNSKNFTALITPPQEQPVFYEDGSFLYSDYGDQIYEWVNIPFQIWKKTSNGFVPEKYVVDGLLMDDFYVFKLPPTDSMSLIENQPFLFGGDIISKEKIDQLNSLNFYFLSTIADGKFLIGATQNSDLKVVINSSGKILSDAYVNYTYENGELFGYRFDEYTGIENYEKIEFE